MTLNSNFVSIFRRYLSVAWEGFPDASPFSLVHALTDILMPTVHKTANIAANRADPGEITSKLHHIFVFIPLYRDDLVSFI